jgi:hypothetical protein
MDQPAEGASKRRKTTQNPASRCLKVIDRFRPVMKLIEKSRIGSQVKKKYDRAKTPYQRVLESSFISRQGKEELKQEYAELNPVRLNPSSTAAHLELPFQGHYRVRQEVLASGESTLFCFTGGGIATPAACNTLPHTPLSGVRSRYCFP